MNDNKPVDPTQNMSPLGKALFNCFRSSDPNQQLAALNEQANRPLNAIAEDARRQSQNGDYADKAGFRAVRDSSGGAQFYHDDTGAA